jgi:hypothetical protein
MKKGEMGRKRVVTGNNGDVYFGHPCIVAYWILAAGLALI